MSRWPNGRDQAIYDEEMSVAMVSRSVVGIGKWLAIAVLIAGFGLACGEGEMASPDCEVSSDCEDGQFCDQAIGVCIVPRTDIPTSRPAAPGVEDGDDSSLTNATPGDPSDPEPLENTTEPDNQSNPGDPNDPNENSSTPEPGDNSEEGDPADACAQEFDGCDPNKVQPAGFRCAADEAGHGTCYMSCEQPGGPSTCGVARMCVSTDDGAICAPRECDGHSDCVDGTCIELRNSYSICIDDGPGGPGSLCEGGETGQCQQGLACDGASGTIGECGEVCDPWSASNCSILEACTLRWSRTGVCTDYLTSYGTSSLASCSPAGAWCDDAIRCVNLGSSNLCLEYCRPGAGDCGGSQICDDYFYYGIDYLGVCMPPCSGDSSCPDGWSCVDQICREPCTIGADCCSEGAENCPAECVAGLCE